MTTPNQKHSNSLPEAEFILVETRSSKGDAAYKVISLDELLNTDEDKEIKKTKYLNCVDQYGISKVRYCKVIPTKLKQEIQIGDEIDEPNSQTK